MNEDFGDVDFGDEYYEFAKEKLLEELNDKYFVIRVNDYIKFANFLTNEKIDYDKVDVVGFSYEELNSLHDKLVLNGVSIIVIQFSLMKKYLDGEGLNKLLDLNQ